MIFENTVPMPRVVTLPEGHSYGHHGFAWNKQVFLTFEEAMETRRRYIAKLEHKLELLKKILHEELDEPCNSCECRLIDGSCQADRVYGETCFYDICDDVVNDIIRRIISEV